MVLTIRPSKSVAEVAAFGRAETEGRIRTKQGSYATLPRDEPTYRWAEIEDRLSRIRDRGREDVAVFFRHGLTKYNERNLVSGQHDTVLSKEGREQARRMRKGIPPQIDLIVCSALVRSIETMDLSVPDDRRMGIPIVIDPRLNEVNLGVLQGRRRQHLQAFELGDLDYAPDHGESYRQAARRVLSVVVDIFDNLAQLGTAPRYAAVFCHAGVLRILATLVNQGRDPKEVFANTLQNTEQLVLANHAVRLPSYWSASF